MKPQISTSVEQSRRLLACGVDPKTADMCIITYPDGNQQTYVGQIIIKVGTIFADGVLQGENLDIKGEPVLSLSRLLELIPQRILAPHADTPCDFILHHHPELWIAMYHDGKSYGDSEDYMWQCVSEQRADNPIEACVKMVEWLVANGYKLNIN